MLNLFENNNLISTGNVDVGALISSVEKSKARLRLKRRKKKRSRIFQFNEEADGGGSKCRIDLSKGGGITYLDDEKETFVKDFKKEKRRRTRQKREKDLEVTIISNNDASEEEEHVNENSTKKQAVVHKIDDEHDETLDTWRNGMNKTMSNEKRIQKEESSRNIESIIDIADESDNENSKKGSSLQEVACPMCDRLFTIGHIEQHADTCEGLPMECENPTTQIQDPTTQIQDPTTQSEDPNTQIQDLAPQSQDPTTQSQRHLDPNSWVKSFRQRRSRR